MIMKNHNKSESVVKVFFRVLPLAYHASRGLFILNTVLNILHGLSYGFLTIFLQRFFDSAIAFSAGSSELRSVIVSLMFLTIVHLFNLVVNGIENAVEESYIEKGNGRLGRKIHEKLSKIKAICFEDNEFLDLIEKAEQGKVGILFFVQSVVLVITFYPPYFLLMFSYFANLSPILVLSIVLAFVPTVVSYIVRVKVFHDLENSVASLRRQGNYWEKCCVDREYFKETRLLGGFSFFFRKFKEVVNSINKLTLKVDMRNNIYDLFLKLFTSICYLAIGFILFLLLMDKKITPGAFAAVFSSIGTLFDIMEEVIFSYMGRMSQQIGIMVNYYKLMQHKEESGKCEQLQSTDIEIKLNNVSFRYPNDDKNALENVNISIRKGEKVAIVGANGSGKSTLVRIILGLYEPTIGCVEYDGIDTRRIDKQSLFSRISATFQKFQRYQMTFRRNIQISDSEGKKNIDHVLSDLDININEWLPDGNLDTVLSREFGGIELSGGQWQKIAIARGFYRSHEFIALDEPTAALDPYQEAKINEMFETATKNKTAIIVTHRMNSLKLADRIFVLKNGMLIESGSHKELMDQHGEYERMYKLQSQWYVDE